MPVHGSTVWNNSDLLLCEMLCKLSCQKKKKGKKKEFIVSKQIQLTGLWRKEELSNSPVRISFLTLNVSTMGVIMPSMVPNILPSPKFTNMRKNMTDQKGEAGKWVIASVNAIKAKPVP